MISNTLSLSITNCEIQCQKRMTFKLLHDFKGTNEKWVVAPNLTREDPRVILLV